MRSLDLPSEILQDDSRQEVLRAWIDGGMLSLSVCHRFPEDYTRSPLDVWPMLLSDIFHHVVDAIVLENELPRAFVKRQLKAAFEDVTRSERGSRTGVLKCIKHSQKQLPDPDVSGGEHCVEIVRILLLESSIRVIVRVGMWLPDDEEGTWGNLLYDLAFMIATSIRPSGPEGIRDTMIERIGYYIDHPSTRYSGNYYGGSDTDTGRPSGAGR